MASSARSQNCELKMESLIQGLFRSKDMNPKNLLSFDPVVGLRNLSTDLENVDVDLIRNKDFETVKSIGDLEKKCEHLAQLCESKAHIHPDWLLLAGRVKVEYLKTIVPTRFSVSCQKLRPILHPEYFQFVCDHSDELDQIIVESRDYRFNSFAMGNLMKSYLARLKKDEQTFIFETPQYMYLRIATYLWYPKGEFSLEKSLENIKDMYNVLSLGQISMASPCMFNAGLFRPQLASCFTMVIGDNMQSISKGWHDTAIISMNSGGIGIDFSSLRHSEIGQHGESGGTVPWIGIYSKILQTVDQGGKRKGSGTGYLGPWHIDIEEFLDLRKPTGPEEMRARHMTYALSIPDEFMRRVENDQMWTLFCPNKAKNLDTTWGLEWELLYAEYEQKVAEGKMTHYRQIKARDLWRSIIQTQIETGMPFMLYRDAMNRKSNQQNLGTTRLSNLCMEMTLYTDDKTLPSCNLGSVNLAACVENGVFDYDLLHRLTRKLVRYINQVIDRTYYPKEIPEIEITNFKNRPLGIGTQALADAFALMDLPWTCKEAREVNELIAETMYHGAVSESMEMAKETGAYETFKGSPASKGLFQFDLWDSEKMEREYSKRSEALIDYKYLQENMQNRRGTVSDRYDWETLRKDMMTHGLKNSLLIALMPTASSASILGNNECFEPYTRHVYARTVLSGQYIVVNPHLVVDLQKINLWNGNTIKQIMKDGGSIADLPYDGLEEWQISRLKFLKIKYLTVFEISQRVLLDMALDRGRYVCQTQSLNCWMKDPDFTKLSAYHFYGWKGGAKTGMYYMHQPARVDPMNPALNSIVSEERKNIICTDDVCVSCST
jgi:ribonucleoside-diphosphate reductase alpha chain